MRWPSMAVWWLQYAAVVRMQLQAAATGLHHFRHATQLADIPAACSPALQGHHWPPLPKVMCTGALELPSALSGMQVFWYTEQVRSYLHQPGSLTVCRQCCTACADSMSSIGGTLGPALKSRLPSLAVSAAGLLAGTCM